MKRLERVERPVLGGAEFLGEPDAGVLSLCVIDFREQVFVAVHGRSASDHERCGQQHPKQLQQTADEGHFRVKYVGPEHTLEKSGGNALMSCFKRDPERSFQQTREMHGERTNVDAATTTTSLAHTTPVTDWRVVADRNS